MQPTTTTSTFFAADQDWLFRVLSWDTPQTVLENGVSSEGMRLRVLQPPDETSAWSTYVSTLRSGSANTSLESAFTNTANAMVVVADGRWPVVQTYWGSGTPNWWGGGRTGRVALCYSGTLVPSARRAWLSSSDEFTFALAGSGWARIDMVDGGSVVTLWSGDLTEAGFLSDGFRFSSTQVFSATSELRIYYAQGQGDPWGGLVVKVIAGSRPIDADLKAAAAAAPVVGCGLFSHGAPVEAVELPFIISANVSQEPGAASRVELEIPLINPDSNDGSGWVFFQSDPLLDPGVLRVHDGGSLIHTLKRKRLLQVQVARKEAVPQWTPIFTGHVDDFSSGSNGRLTIQGVSFEGRMVEQYEQAPDRISYMARGFQVLDYGQAEPTDRIQPVYNVPAFDNWPLGWAVEELAVRAGIDPSCFTKSWLAVQADGVGVPVELPWGAGKRFRAHSLSGDFVRLPRAVHYGNVGLSFTETRPFDDAYIFQVEPTKDLWARVRELTDRLGYVCRFDATGAAVLYPANAPAFVQDLSAADVTSGSVAAVVNPSAYGAKYLTVASGAAATLTTTVKGSRVDISFPRVAGARAWTVTVTPTAGGAAVATKVISPNSSELTPQLFFNSTVTAAGANRTVYTVFSGDYRQYTVTLSASAAAGTAYVDCVLVYAQDPDYNQIPVLSTSDAAMSVTTRAQQDAVRNKVTIVGRRKGAVTDSDKFAEAQAPTEQEYVVQNAVDVGSIVDRTAANYVGYLKQSVIYDSSIADDGLARYLAQVFIYRQSVPRAGTSVTHTLLPMLEPGDPVSVEESHYGTASSSTVQYVRKVTHQIGANSFKTSLETEAWPDYPAYQPRTDINLADFDNKPIVGLQIAYSSISGHSITNPSVSAVTEVSGNTVFESNVAVSGGVLAIPSGVAWPPVPGTFQMSPNYGNTSTTVTDEQSFSQLASGYWTAGQRVHTFVLGEDWTVASVSLNLRYEVENVQDQFSGVTFTDQVPPGTTNRNGYFYYEESDGRLSVYRGTRQLEDTFMQAIVTLKYRVSTGDGRTGWLANNPYHRFVAVNYTDNPGTKVSLPWEQLTGKVVDDGISSASIRYRSLFPDVARTDPNGGVSPFYDPYTSELGNLVSFKFSVLADGLYRVSVRNWDDGTIVAWLTNPASDPIEDEQHWEYIPIMADRQFTWDGVDQVGLWNATQSELYSELVQGTFQDGGRPRVGRGFYAWNREIGGGDLGPLAYIWMARNGDGTPIIGQGTYAKWYVHIEAETTTVADTLVSSKDEALNIAVLTHLPEPTKLELTVEDFDPNTQSWVSPTVSVSPSTVGAFINNAKPVRVRFKTAPRPGALWAGKDSEVAVKLTREVHLRAVIADQTVVFKGSEFAGSTVEERTIYNRRLVNDEHTQQYVDTGYRKSKTFRWAGSEGGEAVTEWVFYPSSFKKAFRIAGFAEPIEFGNYLQLEEVPEWNGARGVTAARSRLNFALMSYLFYLSAYVTDRSGRSSWGINRSFVDKSKVYVNAAPLTWPLDPMYEQRRTVVCRQWTGETAWKSAQLSTFGFGSASNTLFSKLLESFWHQHDITSTTIGTTPANWASFSLPTDAYSNSHVSSVSDFKVPGVYGSSSRQLGDLVGGTTPTSLLGRNTSGQTTTGLWNWESAPVWIPSITRDLHPFFLLPPMISPPRPLPPSPTHPGLERDYRKLNCYWTVGGPTVKVSARINPTNTTDISTSDAGAAETWTSPVMDYTGSQKRFWPGQQVDSKAKPFKDDLETLATARKWLNYVRQDEMVHYEDLRGAYSRSKYPIGQPVKISPSGAYYINPFRYAGIEVGDTLNESSYPLFHALVNEGSPATSVEWFRIAFRSEYVWESGSMFPTSRNGAERLEGVLWWKHRFIPLANNLFYDYGAWTGWKDDDASQTAVMGGRRISPLKDSYVGPAIFGNPFTTRHLPVGTGPTLPQTMELTCHLVLLNDRRGS